MSNFKLKYLTTLVVVAVSIGLIYGATAPSSMILGSSLSSDSLVPQRVDSTRLQTDSLPQRRRGSEGNTSRPLAKPNVSKPVEAPAQPQQALGDILQGTNNDSLYYDVKNNRVFIYDKGDITYQGKNLKADFMQVDMSNNEIFAYGSADTVDGAPVINKPSFTDGTTYDMDTISYNLKSGKAKIRNVATQEGDGWLIGSQVKKMEDNTINIQGGKYTTCDCTDHPHFYIAMTKAKVIPNNKVITGYAYLVIEDVPTYIGFPEAFFPINKGPKSGLLMPTYGEEASRGFFLRDLGYYFTLSEHMDLTVLGGIYSLGSWEASATSRYIKRYKYSGNLNLNYSNIKVGSQGDPDYSKQSAVKIAWTHSQDPKANPGSTFSASVNFTTSGFNKYAANNLNDILATQTNSSIAYSKSWAGTPFSLSTNMSVSQNSQTQALSLTLPSAVFRVSSIYPFKSKNAMGKEKWYQKISMSYTGSLTNSVTAQEDEILKPETFDKMKNGIKHVIPVQASFTAFNYLNITPSFNYNERWYLKSVRKEWNPETNKLEEQAPEYGFNRLYDYSTSVSANTTIYGMIQNANKKAKVQAIRHVLSPQFGFSYTPDFGQQKYGYQQTVQSDSTGRTQIYSPYSTNAYGVPSSGQNMSMNFSLGQNVEMKVLSDRDTSGMRKIKLIENLSLSGSYNFLADSMKLSTISASFKTTLYKSFGLQLNATIDPYKVSPEGRRYDQLFFPGRITSTGWSFGYSFQSSQSNGAPVVNDINSIPIEYQNPFYDPYGTMDPTLRRQYMSQAYYDFSLPWNFGFNYSVRYGVRYLNNGTTGYESVITQTLGFNGSLTLTKKLGMTFSGGYDIESNSLTASSININRDLHCWQMSFQWVPFGRYRSWSFNIGVKASSLADLKYDKSQSMYDNMY